MGLSCPTCANRRAKNGFYAKGTAIPDSDVDIAVIVENWTAIMGISSLNCSSLVASSKLRFFCFFEKAL
ncbi:MAG: nucleotidyltransferase domain-containing protein [Firmicutes bacterium]|nr:nucleotidyltransferase domain-containing protein [Bacillota bacterium]